MGSELESGDTSEIVGRLLEEREFDAVNGAGTYFILTGTFNKTGTTPPPA
jgi:hypothetical protein